MIRYVVTRTRAVTFVPDDDAVVFGDLDDARLYAASENIEWDGKARHHIYEIGAEVDLGVFVPKGATDGND